MNHTKFVFKKYGHIYGLFLYACYRYINKKIKLNYPDPFLKTQTGIALKHVEVVKSRPKENLQVVSSYQWPDIRYKGLLVNQDNHSRRLAVAVINGKESIIREGEIVADVRVVSFDNNQVQFIHDKESKTFMK